MDSGVCTCKCARPKEEEWVATLDLQLLEGLPKCSRVQIQVFKAVSSPVVLVKCFIFCLRLKVIISYRVTVVILHPN